MKREHGAYRYFSCSWRFENEKIIICLAVTVYLYIINRVLYFVAACVGYLDHIGMLPTHRPLLYTTYFRTVPLYYFLYNKQNLKSTPIPRPSHYLSPSRSHHMVMVGATPKNWIFQSNYILLMFINIVKYMHFSITYMVISIIILWKLGKMCERIILIVNLFISVHCRHLSGLAWLKLEWSPPFGS